MIKEFIPLTNDLLFKEAMSHVDNREALIYFLKSTTNISEDVIRKNLEVKYESILNKTKIKDKNLRGDIIIKFDKYYINLEGYSNFDNNSLAKSTSYIMRIFSTQLERGEPYDNLESMIQINIIENDETNTFKDYVNEYYITNAKDIENKILPDKFMIKYYNLDKIKEGPYNEIDDEMRWIKFIGAKSSEERRKIAKGNRLLTKMDNWVEEYINDEKTKKLFGEWGENIALEKGFRKGLKQGFDQGMKEGLEQGLEQGFDQGLEQGFDQGLEQGQKENSLEIAKILKEKKFSKEEIMEITKLSSEEIDSII